MSMSLSGRSLSACDSTETKSRLLCCFCHCYFDLRRAAEVAATPPTAAAEEDQGKHELLKMLSTLTLS